MGWYTSAMRYGQYLEPGEKGISHYRKAKKSVQKAGRRKRKKARRSQSLKAVDATNRELDRQMDLAIAHDR